jgi:hypothetical protein
LSFSPFFERSWASLYEALEDGQINAAHLRQPFVDFAPLPEAGEKVFLEIDSDKRREAWNVRGEPNPFTIVQSRSERVIVSEMRKISDNACSFNCDKQNSRSRFRHCVWKGA